MRMEYEFPPKSILDAESWMFTLLDVLEQLALILEQLALILEQLALKNLAHSEALGNFCRAL